MKQAAKVILINLENQILLYLRDEKKGISFPGYWDFIGGGIKRGESNKTAIKREITEEIGVEVSNLEEIGEIYCKKSKLNLTNYRVSIFRGDINIPIDAIDLREGQKLGLFKIKDMFKIKFPFYYRNFILENKAKIFKYNTNL